MWTNNHDFVTRKQTSLWFMSKTVFMSLEQLSVIYVANFVSNSFN